MHTSTSSSPFEIIYGFNPLTPLDLIPLPIDERSSLDGHMKVTPKIEKFAYQANKERQRFIFDPRGWVWVHIRKEKKFQPIDGLNCILEAMDLSKSLRKLMIMPIKWFFTVSIMSLLLSMFLIFLPMMQVTIRGFESF